MSNMNEDEKSDQSVTDNSMPSEKNISEMDVQNNTAEDNASETAAQPFETENAAYGLFEEPVNSISSMPAEMPKKKPWLIPVLGLLGAVIVAIAVLFFSPGTANAISLAIMKPADYYQKIETANLASSIDSFSKSYGKWYQTYRDMITKGFGMDTSITASVDPSLTSLIGLSDLKNMELKMSSMSKNMTGKATSKLLVNDKEALTFDLYSDPQKGMVYYLVPDLNQAYLNISMDELYDDPTYTSVSKKTRDLIINNPLTEQILNSTLKKYTKIFTEGVNTITLKKNVSVSSNNLSGNYNELTVSFTEEDLYYILEKVLTTASADEDLASICEKADLYTKKEYKAAVLESLSDLKENKDSFINTDSDDTIFMKVWVDLKGGIIGREFTSSSDDGVSIGYSSISKEEKDTFEFWFSKFGTDLIRVKGSGTKDADSKYSGDMIVSFTNSYTAAPSSFKITSKDLNLADMENGYLNGNLSISSDLLSAIKINMNCSGSKEKQTVTIDIVQGNVSLASLSMKTEYTDFTDFELPSASDKTYNLLTESEEYMDSSDLTGFLTRLNKKVDLELLHYYLDELTEEEYID